MRMISKVFVDTNVFVTTRDFNDSTHQKAVDLSEYLLANEAAWYTSSDIIAESLTVLSQKLGKSVALDWYKDFKNGNIKEIFVDEILHREARSFFTKIKSKNVSFVDCSSAVAMKRNKIDVIFSFDEDFKGMGIKLEQYANFNKRILFNDPPGSVITSIATFDLFIVSSTVMIRTDTLKKIDGFIQDKYCPFLDIPTYLQLSLIGTFYYQKEILGYYRRHSFSHWYNFAKETETMGWKEMRQGINDFLLQNENKIKKSGIDINIKQIITTQNRKLEHKRKYKNCSLFLNSFLIRNNLLLPFLYLRFLISYSYYVTKKRFL